MLHALTLTAFRVLLFLVQAASSTGAPEPSLLDQVNAYLNSLTVEAGPIGPITEEASEPEPLAFARVVCAPALITKDETGDALPEWECYFQLGVSTDDLSLLLCEPSYLQLHIVGSSFFT